MLKLQTKLISLGLGLMTSGAVAFSVFGRHPITSTSTFSKTILFSGGERERERERDLNENTTNQTKPILMTQEMFYREVLADPAGLDKDNKDTNVDVDVDVNVNVNVKRKKKNGSRYRPLDNRDSLPFIVKDCTPDPYTDEATMKKEATKNTKLHNEKVSKDNKKSKKNANAASRQNLVGLNKSGIASSIYKRGDDGTLDRVLGEFKLDKSTNCGDLLEVGDREYQVLRAKCQYKYAGGKRFVMVRKILEVKEVTRLAEESYLKRQFEKDPDPPSFE